MHGDCTADPPRGMPSFPVRRRRRRGFGGTGIQRYRNDRQRVSSPPPPPSRAVVHGSQEVEGGAVGGGRGTVLHT